MFDLGQARPEGRALAVELSKLVREFLTVSSILTASPRGHLALVRVQDGASVRYLDRREGEWLTRHAS